MGLNICKGNMYSFVTHTWNTVKGACPHGCEYCYMTKWGPQKPVRFDESELKTDLGEGNFIFVGSSCDMWADKIPAGWINTTLEHCAKYDNRYLFQSKDPNRFFGFRFNIPANSTVGTTIESNRLFIEMGHTPPPGNRAASLGEMSLEYETMVTIEPIMDFDLEYLVHLISDCRPKWVNIGANTHATVSVPEPPKGKVIELIAELEKFTEVKIKSNLKRITGGHDENIT